jgi:putative glutamine amidotransferase
MTLEALIDEQTAPLTRRLRRILGDQHAAEDVRQEAFARLWTSAPHGAGADALRGWLHRTATNLALDELRRRRVRRALPFEEALDGAAGTGDPDEALATREALARLTPHERLVLLLRFQAGLSHREIGALLDVAEDAARKRVSRARSAFAAALREVSERRAPRVAVLVADAAPDDCVGWLTTAGATPVVLDPATPGLTLAGADAFVLSGSYDDIHPSLYGEQVGPFTVNPDVHRDRRDLALLQQALTDDLPVVGVCRGGQLLNIALGGSLWQDLPTQTGTTLPHGGEDAHPIRTGEGSALREIVGRGAEVGCGHHQAVRRLGRGVRPTAVAPDGAIESIEVPGRRFAIGLQWHPEAAVSHTAGPAIAEALVRAAAA